MSENVKPNNNTVGRRGRLKKGAPSQLDSDDDSPRPVTMVATSAVEVPAEVAGVTVQAPQIR